MDPGPDRARASGPIRKPGGPVDWMEVDREAGLVRLHGVTNGKPFVETYRITQATLD